MGQIDIGTVYTVAISFAIVVAITSFNIAALDKLRNVLFVWFARINIIIISLSAIYFAMFSYQAFKDYDKFLLEKGSYDKYAIQSFIYYGIFQIGVFLIYKIVRFISRNRRMIK